MNENMIVTVKNNFHYYRAIHTTHNSNTWCGMGNAISFSNSRPRHKHGPDVLDYAWRCEWSKLSRRLVTHPEESRTLNFNGRTALHLACFSRPPLEVVQELIRANPQALFRRDIRSRYTPLHLLCRFGAEDEVLCEVVQVMMRMVMDSSLKSKSRQAYRSNASAAAIAVNMRDTMRSMLVTGEVVNVWDDTHFDAADDFFRSDMSEKVQAPLYLACLRGASIQTIQTLSIDMNETLVSSQFEISTQHQHMDVLEESLGALWVWFDKRIASSIPISHARLYWCSQRCHEYDPRIDWKDVEEFRAAYSKIDLLLKQIAGKRGISLSLNVHTVASLHRSIPDLLDYVIRLFPNQIYQRDQKQDLPLHLFLRNNCITDHWARGVEVITTAYPESTCIPDGNGNFPLTVLLHRNRQMHQGISQILKFNPESLSSCCSATGTFS